MKSKLILVGTLALAFSAAPAHSQRLGVAIGANVPTSTLDETHDVGYHGAVSIEMRRPGSIVGFRPEVAWYQFGGEGSLGDLRSLAATANLTLALPGTSVHPYLIGGVGYYNTKVEDVDSDDSFGLNAGVGLNFLLAGRTSAYIEARMHHVVDGIQRGGDDRNAQFIPISFGIRF
ncbi:MAG TPA: outer membrane beta-barrel protein [Gemmatimonadales bacterium]|nr:outer membrane beta-barrel protein [Gemmatimonadales bacterium]